MNLWTKEERERGRGNPRRLPILDTADHTVTVLAELLDKAVNRLRNQGGDISEITHEANMVVVREAEAVLEKVR